MRILIVGCGRLGSAAAEQLVADGHGVFGLRRSQRPLPDGVIALRGDVAAGRFDLPKRLDAVIYSVAASTRTDEGYRLAYVVGLENVLEALKRDSSNARVLFVSSTGVYGHGDGSEVDESTIPAPMHFTGIRMLEAEAVAKASPFEACALRLSGLYGPSRRVLLDRVRAGEATYPASAEGWMNQLHEEDAARALVHVLGTSALPETLCVSDTRPSPRAEVLTWLAERLGAPRPRAMDTTGPASTKRVRSTALVDTGFRFRYPTYVEGYSSFLPLESS
ncbi:NAD dependent epimerase/dehydratase family protein [Planctomycetes bacterium Poly30]|uniref:NAD dependent epimerase/dehydratase family protein n=1 Tax=Saltatorellus ferox TaxID=2528018 RepID=A0A518EWM0_9BACT|nr:NAD dependent epimerase/dehydratase family protein [Planctomycetes bacterium Poly30]